MSLVSKRYAKALIESFDKDELVEVQKFLSSIASNFGDRKFRMVLTSNLLPKEEKEKLLLGSISNPKLQNFIRLLIHKGRISEIPAIAENIRKELLAHSDKFEGKIYTSSNISIDELKSVANGLSRKLGKNIVLVHSKSDSDEVKIVIEDLNIEVSLSKEKIERDIVQYILKAI